MIEALEYLLEKQLSITTLRIFFIIWIKNHAWDNLSLKLLLFLEQFQPQRLYAFAKI